MAENQWGDDDLQPVQQKKGIPTWVKIGCGGCGVLLLIAILGVGFLFTKFKDMRNPDVQYAKLAEVLPFDERPDYDITGFQIGQDQFTLTDLSTGVQGQITRVQGANGEEARENIFGGDVPEVPSNLWVMKFEEFEKGTVDVQGRTLPLVRFRMEAGTLLKKAADGENPLGPSSFVDLTKPGGDFVMFQLTIPRQEGPVTDEQIRAFLEPFHVGPEREVWTGGETGDAVRERLDEATREAREAVDQAAEDAADTGGDG